MSTLKFFNYFSIYVDFYQVVKNHNSCDTVNFRAPQPDSPHLFLTMPNQKLLIFRNLYQHAKDEEAVSLICSGEVVDLVVDKILQSDWLRTFLPLSQEQEFS